MARGKEEPAQPTSRARGRRSGGGSGTEQDGGGGKKAGKRRLLGRRRKKWAMSSDERRAERRGRALRILACVGVLFLLLILALVVGSDEYAPTLVGWIPFIMAATAIVIAFLYVRFLKLALKITERNLVADCTRNEDVRFKITFKNRSPLFFFRMEAHFFTADLHGSPVSHRATTIALAPFETYEMAFTTRFEHIGTYQAGLDRVVIYDFLRLFRVNVEGPKRARVQVIPRIVPVKDVPFSDDTAVETQKAARAVLADSMDYAQVREYVWGDPMKNVHWKLSARTEELMTKLFEVYTNPGVAIMLDFYGPGQDVFDMMKLFDCVVETGFSVGRYAQWRGLETEVHYCDRFGGHIQRSTWRKDDLPAIVSDMPQFSNDPRMEMEAIRLIQNQIRSPSGQSNIVICSANLSARMVETVVEAKICRRNPILFAAVPKRLEGRERDAWVAPLSRLDAEGISYIVLSSVDEISGVMSYGV